MSWRLLVSIFGLLVLVVSIAIGLWSSASLTRSSPPNPRSHPHRQRSARPTALSLAVRRTPARQSSEPQHEPVMQQDGEAAYYAEKYQGRPTASGERFTQDELTAASPSLPLGARATIIDRENGGGTHLL
jgi:rare lipoprotein A (peptidoglycan hydrolase)